MARTEGMTMKARILGSLGGMILGALLGSGTGIVGGVFVAVAGASVFMLIGAAWGLSAGPDVARILGRWSSK